MKPKYIILHPDEDGDTATFADEKLLDEVLNQQYMGEVNVLTETDLEKKGTNPQHWSYHKPAVDILILEIKRIVKVRPAVQTWEVEEE
ncbi:MAG: hypothetical protein WC325_13860 [Candidatus Bathyarchaeia archaeon]